MSEHQASRTLLKSAPELWAECSDAQSLARHLDTFGEIRITRLEPESTVAWEGERGRGTVTLEPSGWGTRVTLTAKSDAQDEPVDAAESEAPPQGHDQEVPVALYRPPMRPATFLARLLRRFSAEPPDLLPGRGALRPRPIPAGPEPRAEASGPLGPTSAGPERPTEAAGPLEPASAAPEPGRRADLAPVSSETADALATALESLGQAHHRPFSRA